MTAFPRPDRPLLSRLAGLLALGLVACGSERDEPEGPSPETPSPTAEGPPNLLLITLDTTRADALACSGGNGQRMPRLEEFARECLRFSLARSPSPLTVPAHTSMMTGLYPFAHGVRDNDAYCVHPDALTLALELQDGGYRTEAVLAASVLSQKTGLGLGFELYDDLALRRGRNVASEVERGAVEVSDRAIARLELEDGRPWFLWVHYFDPHYPYTPPGDIPDPADNGAYWGEVQHLDRELHRLIEQARARTDWNRTAVMVIGDHGEGLGSGMESSHGFLCEESTLRIPLLLRVPGAAQTGDRPEPTSSVDVYTTLLSLAGRDTPYPIHGVDLLGDDRPGDRLVYFESLRPLHVMGWNPLYGVADDRGKFVRNTGDEWFDLRAEDPEATNLAAEQPAQVEDYRRRMIELESSVPTSFDSTAMKLDPAEQARLLQLGYLARAVDEAEVVGPRPDPRQHYPTFLRYQQALGHARQGRIREALDLLTDIVQRYPKNPSFRTNYGELLLWAGQVDSAKHQLEAAVALQSDHLGALFALARTQLRLRERDQALATLDQVLSLHPGHFDALRSRMGLRAQREEFPAALEDACALLEHHPPGAGKAAADFEEILRLLRRTATQPSSPTGDAAHERIRAIARDLPPTHGRRILEVLH